MSRYSIDQPAASNSRGPPFGQRPRDAYLNPALSRAAARTPRSSINVGGLHFRVGLRPTLDRRTLRPGEHRINNQEDIRGLLFRLANPDVSHLYVDAHKWKETTDCKTSLGSHAQTTEVSVPKVANFMLVGVEAEKFSELHHVIETTAETKHLEEEGSKVNQAFLYLDMLQKSLVQGAKQDCMKWLQEIYSMLASKEGKLAQREHEKQVELHKKRLRCFVDGSLQVLNKEEIKKVCDEVQDVHDQMPEDTTEQKDAKKFVHTYYEVLWEAYNKIRRQEEDERLERNQMNPYPENHIMEQDWLSKDKIGKDGKCEEDEAFGWKKVDLAPDTQSQEAWIRVPKEEMDKEAVMETQQVDVDGCRINKKEDGTKQDVRQTCVDDEASFSSLSQPYVPYPLNVAKGHGTASLPYYFSDSSENSVSSHESESSDYYCQDRKPAAMPDRSSKQEGEAMSEDESYGMMPRQPEGKEGVNSVNSVYRPESPPPSVDSEELMKLREKEPNLTWEEAMDILREKGLLKVRPKKFVMEEPNPNLRLKRKRGGSVSWNEDSINPTSTRKYLQKLRSYARTLDTKKGSTNENFLVQLVQDMEVKDLLKKKEVFDKLPKCKECGGHDGFPNLGNLCITCAHQQPLVNGFSELQSDTSMRSEDEKQEQVEKRSDQGTCKPPTNTQYFSDSDDDSDISGLPPKLHWWNRCTSDDEEWQRILDREKQLRQVHKRAVMASDSLTVQNACADRLMELFRAYIASLPIGEFEPHLREILPEIRKLKVWDDTFVSPPYSKQYEHVIPEAKQMYIQADRYNQSSAMISILEEHRQKMVSVKNKLQVTMTELECPDREINYQKSVVHNDTLPWVETLYNIREEQDKTSKHDPEGYYFADKFKFFLAFDPKQNRFVHDNTRLGVLIARLANIILPTPKEWSDALPPRRIWNGTDYSLATPAIIKQHEVDRQTRIMINRIFWHNTRKMFGDKKDYEKVFLNQDFNKGPNPLTDDEILSIYITACSSKDLLEFYPRIRTTNLVTTLREIFKKGEDMKKIQISSSSTTSEHNSVPPLMERGSSHSSDFSSSEESLGKCVKGDSSSMEESLFSADPTSEQASEHDSMPPLMPRSSSDSSASIESLEKWIAEKPNKSELPFENPFTFKRLEPPFRTFSFPSFDKLTISRPEQPQVFLFEGINEVVEPDTVQSREQKRGTPEAIAQLCYCITSEAEELKRLMLRGPVDIPITEFKEKIALNENADIAQEAKVLLLRKITSTAAGREATIMAERLYTYLTKYIRPPQGMPIRVYMLQVEFLMSCLPYHIPNPLTIIQYNHLPTESEGNRILVMSQHEDIVFELMKEPNLIEQPRENVKDKIEQVVQLKTHLEERNGRPAPRYNSNLFRRNKPCALCLRKGRGMKVASTHTIHNCKALRDPYHFRNRYHAPLRGRASQYTPMGLKTAPSRWNNPHNTTATPWRGSRNQGRGNFGNQRYQKKQNFQQRNKHFTNNNKQRGEVHFHRKMEESSD